MAIICNIALITSIISSVFQAQVLTEPVDKVLRGWLILESKAGSEKFLETRLWRSQADGENMRTAAPTQGPKFVVLTLFWGNKRLDPCHRMKPHSPLYTTLKKIDQTASKRRLCLAFYLLL